MNKKEKRTPEVVAPAYKEFKVNPYNIESGMANQPMTAAMNSIDAFSSTGHETDPLGMWTGNPKIKNEKPIQDADDL